MINDVAPYSDLYEDSYISCDYVGDFFISPLVKRAFGDVWNTSCMPLDELENTKDFDIYDPKHLGFIRDVGEINQYGKLFLQALRKRSIQIKNIGKFQYDFKHITGFILLWREIQFRLRFTPESLTQMFNQRASDIILDIGEQPALTDGEQVISRFQGLNPLTSSGFSPIDENGDILYGLEDRSEFYEFFKVINEKGDIFFIDKNGKILEDQSFDHKKIQGLQKEISFYKECIGLLQGVTPFKFMSGRLLKEIDKLKNPTSGNKTQDVINVIKELEQKEKVLNQELRKIMIHTGRSFLSVVQNP